MDEFLVEQYVPRRARAAVEQGAERARRAAGQLTREGRPVRLVRPIFVEEDETCFYLFEAEAADAVRAAAQRADLGSQRISRVMSTSGPRS
jgi:hypothetical protein